MFYQKLIHNSLLAASAALITSAQAEIFTYTDGNLILGFQATAGDGTNKNVFLDLGKATTFRDNGNQGVLGNIGATLVANYGNNWYEREDLWFGVIANLNQQPQSPAIGGRAPVDGDPSRTFYISRAAASPGSASPVAAGTYGNVSLGQAGGNLSGLEKVLAPSEDGTGWDFDSPDVLARGLQKEVDNAGVLNQSLSQHSTAWTFNSWSKWNPTPGAAFLIFTGGIQQNFGKGGSATYVDVQRILPTNTGASPTGVVGGGTYETTISISPSGVVSAVLPSPASAYTTWIDSFNPPLTNALDRAEGADPDMDGIDNLMEFVLNGNPSVSSQAILPTLNASGANFVFSFTRRADSAGDVAQIFEYSTDLVDWTTKAPIAIPTTPGVSGFVTVGASTGTPPNEVQAVSISIPKGSDTKLFGRLKAVK